MKQIFLKLLRDTKGATAIEYGLIVAFIAIAIIGSLNFLGGSVNDTLTKVYDTFVASDVNS